MIKLNQNINKNHQWNNGLVGQPDRKLPETPKEQRALALLPEAAAQGKARGLGCQALSAGDHIIGEGPDEHLCVRPFVQRDRLQKSPFDAVFLRGRLRQDRLTQPIHVQVRPH